MPDYLNLFVRADMYMYPSCLEALFTLVTKTIVTHRYQMLTSAQPASPGADRKKHAPSALIVDEAQHEMW